MGDFYHQSIIVRVGGGRKGKKEAGVGGIILSGFNLGKGNERMHIIPNCYEEHHFDTSESVLLKNVLKDLF